MSLLVYRGVCRLPHAEHYWSKATLLAGSWARSMISTCNRFYALQLFLHVVDSALEDQNDKLRKVRHLNDHMKKKRLELYQPSRNVAIDERMVRSKARFGFKQYIKNKPVRFGVKVFALCDSATKYLCNFKIYTGRAQSGQVEQNLASSVVLELMQPFLDQGYYLFTDNFYTSPTLYADL